MISPPEYLEWDLAEQAIRDAEEAAEAEALDDERAEAEARQRDLAETEVCDG